MSVIVMGIEMPALCQECDLYIDGACYAKGYRDYRSIMDMSKPDDCPLIEVPTPHGRLIDADALNYSNTDYCGNHFVYMVDIEDSPVIIESEASR